MRKLLKVVLLVMPVVMLVSHYGMFIFQSKSTFAGQLKIAFASSLTGPGQEGAQEMLRAVQVYANDANTIGGVDELKVEIIPFDDTNDPDKARAVAEKISSDQSIVAVIGHNYSSASIAAGPVYARAGIPAITPSSTHPDVTRNNPWYFRTIFSDTSQGDFLAQYARDGLNGHAVGVLASDDLYARNIASSFCTAAGLAGLEINGTWWVEPKTPGFEAAIDKAVAGLKALPEDAIILLATHFAPAVTIVRKLRDAGIKNRILGPDSLGATGFTKAFSGFAKDQARPGFYTNGIYVAVPFMTDTGNREARRLIERLEADHGPLKNWGAPYAYDAVKLIVTAAHRAQLRSNGLAGADARKAVQEQLVAMHAQALAITGATGLLRFDTDNTPTKPLEIGQFRGHLVSSLVQLTFDGEADEAGKSRLHKTPVVYVGALFDRIDGIDQKSRTARLSFDLWFRFQGDSPVSDIVFSNAVEPIRMGEPVERVSSKGIEYRRYHVSGRFSLNFDDHRPAADGLIAGLQFTHRTLSYDQLIYVAESGGQAATASSSALATLSETIVPGTDWRINHIYANANIVDRPTLGKPSQVDSGSSSQPFSNFVERVELAPYENSLRRQLTGDTALWAAVAASLALLVCLIIDTGRPKDRSRRRMLTLTVVASGAFLLASEAEIYHLLSIATLEWAQAPLITFFNGLWWVVPASLANMFIDRFIWNKLEEATGHVVPKVIRSFVSAAIYLVAMVGILANVLQKDVTGLIATSGVMAMIIGLALQSNLSNIFSGIVLNLERPFRPGDWIKIGDAPVGRVVDISWRAMQIRAFQNSVISIPNSMVAASRIENFT